mmetsp:Transcript_63367/g.200187  ORF Transcript_63367/g.200187 Transcript_63367/m.200187 type:complete len:332 (-) Transcript_63367:34-1029(-)
MPSGQRRTQLRGGRQSCSHAGLAGSPCLEDAVADLPRDVCDSPRAVREEDGLRLGVRCDVAQGLKVLRNEQQLRHLLRGKLLLRAVRDGVPQTVNDGPTLPRNALALELRGVRGSLGRLDDPDLLGLRRHDRCVAEALLLVDLIHGMHDLSIWRQLRDKGLMDLKAKGCHLGYEFPLDCVGDVILLLESLVKCQRWHLRANNVRDVRVDLLVHVRKLVHGLLHLVRHDRLLHRDFGSDEDVVLRLGLHNNIILLNTAGDGTETDAHAATVNARKGKAWQEDLVKLSKPLHGVELVLRHRDATIAARKASGFLPVRHAAPWVYSGAHHPKDA